MVIPTKTYTPFLSKLSWPTSDKTATKSVLSLSKVFFSDLETNFRYISHSSTLPCLRSGDPWQLIHWKNMYRNEKRYKQISDNYTYNKVRISRISIKVTLKKNCRGGCHWGFALLCAMLQGLQRERCTLHFCPNVTFSRLQTWINVLTKWRSQINGIVSEPLDPA